MNWAIDGVLVLIVAYCAWRGYKNGFIRGVIGILAIIIAIYGANLVAAAYSSEFTGMLEPFVGGTIDKAVTKVVGNGSGTESSFGGVLTGTDKTNVYSVSYAALRQVGVADSAAKLLAEKVSGKQDTVGQSMSVYLTDKFCAVLSYIGVFVVVFILISIVFAVIGNIFNLALTLPGIQTADKFIGLGLGILKGLLIILVLSVVFRYLGLLTGNMVEKTTVLNFILNKNPLASILGI